MAEVKRDCFAYRKTKKDEQCNVLLKLYCREENCKFYKTEEQLNREREMAGGAAYDGEGSKCHKGDC